MAELREEIRRVRLKHTHKKGELLGYYQFGPIRKAWVHFDGEPEPRLESEAMLIPDKRGKSLRERE